MRKTNIINTARDMTAKEKHNQTKTNHIFSRRPAHPAPKSGENTNEGGTAQSNH